MADLVRLIEQVVKISRKAGEFIRTEAVRFDHSAIEHKGLNDLVSYVDKEAERIIVSALAEALPEAGFITEEGTSEKKGDRFNWIVDPLDGTTNFVHSLPIYAVSIALMDEEELVMGVVYEVNRDECFFAVKDGGAYCNGQKIGVSVAAHLSESLIATGFPYYNFEQMPQYLNILNSLMQKTHGLRRMGSAAVDLAYVSCGRFEGFFEYNLNAYDVAAGIVIVREAGGMVSDFEGGDDALFGRQILATNTKIHLALLAEIKRKWDK